MPNKRIAIIGGGAAGLFAAASCTPSADNEIYVFEKNKYTGKKLLITGKGRCNVTNACEQSDFLKNIPVNPKFLFSSFYTFSYLYNMKSSIKKDRANLLGLEILY